VAVSNPATQMKPRANPSSYSRTPWQQATGAASRERRPTTATPAPTFSRADFTWYLTALDWAETSMTWPLASCTERKARENGKKYALLTAQSAAAAVQRRRTTARR